MWVPAGQTVKQAVVITNLSAQTLTSLSFDAGSFSNLTVVNESSCSSLVQNASCTAIFTYAPSAAESQTGNMDVTFNLNGTPYGSILPTTLAASTSQVNIVLESVTATTANSTPSNFLSGGQTSSSDPYQYYNLGNSLQLTLTYKNIGTATSNGRGSNPTGLGRDPLNLSGGQVRVGRNECRCSRSTQIAKQNQSERESEGRGRQCSARLPKERDAPFFGA